MNDLENFFYNKEHRLCHKWAHYFEIYDKHFSRFRGRQINVMEIGVSHGGSIDMWLDYFGPQVKVYGIDIDPQAKQFETERVKIYIGSQGSKNFLRWLTRILPKMDIIIDDGGHKMKQQSNSLEILFPILNYGGVYLCEDLHTSFMPAYGCRWGSFLNKTKKLIDEMYAWYKKSNVESIEIKSVHFLSTICDYWRNRSI